MGHPAHNFVDVTGMRFGRLVVLRRCERNSIGGKARWECRCDCGANHEAASDLLKSGKISSCGCLQRELLQSRNHLTKFKHGKTGTQVYRVWVNMKHRCQNPDADCYANYGGRGISVCARWMDSFEAFVADMGPRPRGGSIDRIDVNGNYEPANCRWASSLEQGRNKRNTRYVEVDGVRGKLPEMAERLGITYSALKNRAARGSFGAKFIDSL